MVAASRASNRRVSDEIEDWRVERSEVRVGSIGGEEDEEEGEGEDEEEGTEAESERDLVCIERNRRVVFAQTNEKKEKDKK